MVSVLPSAGAGAEVVVVVVGEDVGALVAAGAAAGAAGAVGEEDGGAEKNDVMLFCFCFLPIVVEAERAPGNLRLRGADIFSLKVLWITTIDSFFLSFFLSRFAWSLCGICEFFLRLRNMD